MTECVLCGSLTSQLGEYSEAVHCYSAAIAIDPKSSYAYYNRGITRDKLSDFPGAIKVGKLVCVCERGGGGRLGARNGTGIESDGRDADLGLSGISVFPEVVFASDT